MGQEESSVRKTGWLPDSPDDHDYTLKTDQIHALIRKIQIIRGCDSFLETFEQGIKKPFNPLVGIFTGSFGSSAGLQKAISNFRDDLQIILRGLNSGIDLIAASSGDTKASANPLLPPISSKIINILYQQNNLKEYRGFNSINDPSLLKVRKILHQMTPLAKYNRGKALEQKIHEVGDSNFPQLETAPAPENIIKINPETMYSLLENKGTVSSQSASLDPTTGSVNLPLRIPLNSVLSKELRGKAVRHYILPDIVDLSYWCSPVKDQGKFNSCTSHAVASLVEYFQNRMSEQSGSDFSPKKLSVRFLCRVTRHLGAKGEQPRNNLKSILRKAFNTPNEDFERQSENFLDELEYLMFEFPAQLKKIKQELKEEYVEEFLSAMLDTGVSIRQTLKALHLFGIPPTKYWPDNVSPLEFYYEPPQFCYTFAQNYQSVKYFRLDIPGDEGDNNKLVLTQIKAILAAGFPAICGILAHQTEDSTGVIAVPSEAEIQRLKEIRSNPEKGQVSDFLGHAVLVVGYSDVKKAFLFQNSYGSDWGDAGYGWLPYEFVTQKLATDWWSILSPQWIEVGDFGLDSSFGKPKQKKVD